ncbi:hypothetical protein [Streptomyces sp. NPDC005828]|uniref:hypothetical protein n=1 Tax=Streptomyces sp. NPDC005828 TaxID=3157071 RepID=UPI0034052828
MSADSPDQTFAGHVAVVTGAGTGIGRVTVTVTAFAEASAHVLGAGGTKNCRAGAPSPLAHAALPHPRETSGLGAGTGGGGGPCQRRRPGPTHTDVTPHAGLTPEAADDMHAYERERIPTHHIASADEVAHRVPRTADPAGRHTTGQVITDDGGPALIRHRRVRRAPQAGKPNRR